MTASADENPFETACLIAQQGVIAAPLEKQPDCFVSSQAALKYQRELPGDPGLAEKTLQSLLQAFGPENSIRGNIHVWDIAVPTTNPLQSDLVTIIMIYDPSGTSSLIMDRARGGVTFARDVRDVPSAKSRKSEPSARHKPVALPTRPKVEF